MGPACAGLSLCMALLVALVQAEAAGRGLAQVGPPGTMEPGYGLDRDGVKVPCPVGTYNPGGPNLFCLRCGGGWTTKGRGKTSIEDCLIIPGWGWDAPNNTPKPCDKGSWSSGGAPKARLAVCQACPVGFTTQEQESQSANDCEICIAGHGGSTCAICPVNTWSSGGAKASESECNPCDEGFVSSQGSFNVDQCFKAVLEPNFDRLILSDERQWKAVKDVKSEADCAASCVAASKPTCFMSRWNDGTRKCHVLYEYDASKSSGVMGFRVAGGQDYVLWTVPGGLTAGTRIASLKNNSLKECLDACTANNNCEAFTHPGGAAVGACKLFQSELDAEWVTRVHVDGAHLFSNAQVVGGRRQL